MVFQYEPETELKAYLKSVPPLPVKEEDDEEDDGYDGEKEKKDVIPPTYAEMELEDKVTPLIVN